jgi:hypothetical protein
VPLTLSGVERIMEGDESFDFIGKELERKEDEEQLEALLASDGGSA